MVGEKSADAGRCLQKSRGRLQVTMIHVFLLFVYIGIGEDERLVSKDMYVRDLNECVWYAQKLHKQGQKITAYCLPKLVNEDTKVY